MKQKKKSSTNFDKEKASYKKIWNIIDKKWDDQMYQNLHAATCFLNHRFKWSNNMSHHLKVKKYLYNCVEKIVNNP